MSISPITFVLDTSSWKGGHWKLFTVISLNYLIDGIVFSIAPLIVYLIMPEIGPFVFAANLIAETLGAIVLGFLADRKGRRTMFTVAILIEAIAALLLFLLYNNPLALIVLTSLMTFGIGGEFGAAYAAVAELMPMGHRGKVLMLATNFWNIGASLIAGLSLVIATVVADIATQINYLLVSALATLVIVRLTRIVLPESPRWLILRGWKEEAVRIARRLTGYDGEVEAVVRQTSGVGVFEAMSRYRFRFVILAVVTVAQYVTYGMMAYYAPYASGFVFGVEAAPLVVFVGNLGASVGAFILIPLIDRTRRYSNFIAFLGGFISSVAVILFHIKPVQLFFYISLFIALIFSEWAWGALSVLQSELFPTGVRASMVGLLTGLTGVAGAAVVLTANLLTANGFLIAAATIWFAGLAAAAAWLTKGVESARKPVEELE